MHFKGAVAVVCSFLLVVSALALVDDEDFYNDFDIAPNTRFRKRPHRPRPPYGGYYPAPPGNYGGNYGGGNPQNPWGSWGPQGGGCPCGPKYEDPGRRRRPHHHNHGGGYYGNPYGYPGGYHGYPGGYYGQSPWGNPCKCSPYGGNNNYATSVAIGGGGGHGGHGGNGQSQSASFGFGPFSASFSQSQASRGSYAQGYGIYDY